MADEGNGAKLGEAHVEVRVPMQLLNKDLQDTRKAVEQATGNMRRGFEQVQKGVIQTTRAIFGLRGTIGNVIAAVALKEAAFAAKNLADAIEDIGIKARTIGLTADQYQRIVFAARQADIATEELNAGLGIFANNLGQARAGVGPLVDSLKKIDPEFAKQIQGAKDMNDALRITADAIGSLSQAEAKAAVARQAFGRGGLGFVRAFGEGAESLRKAGDEAQRLGQILSDEEIARGGELSDAFTEAGAAIRVQFMRALIEAEPLIRGTINFTLELAKGLKDLSDAFADAGGPIGVFRDIMGGLLKVLSAAPFAIRGISDLLTTSLDEEASQLGDQIDKAQAKLKGLRDDAAKPGLFNMGSRNQWGIDTAEKDLGKLRDRLEEVNQKIKARDFKKGLTTETVEAPKPKGRVLTNLPDEKDLKEAQQKLTEFRQKYLQDTEQFTLLAQQQFDDELKKFKELQDKKLISEQEFIEVRIKLAEMSAKQIKEAWEKENKALLESARTVTAGLEDAFGQWIETGKLDVKEMVRSMLVDLAKLQFRRGVIEPLVGGGDKAGGGLLGSLLRGQGFQFHGGGTVGSGGKPMMVNPALWMGAPRLHDGLMSDEYRAILQKGETVIPKGQGFGTKVEVHNYSGAPVREEQSNEGGVDIRKIIIGTVNEAMGAGRFDKNMNSRYGGRVQTRKT